MSTSGNDAAQRVHPKRKSDHVSQPASESSPTRTSTSKRARAEQSAPQPVVSDNASNNTTQSGDTAAHTTASDPPELSTQQMAAAAPPPGPEPDVDFDAPKPKQEPIEPVDALQVAPGLPTFFDLTSEAGDKTDPSKYTLHTVADLLKRSFEERVAQYQVTIKADKANWVDIDAIMRDVMTKYEDVIGQNTSLTEKCAALEHFKTRAGQLRKETEQQRTQEVLQWEQRFEAVHTDMAALRADHLKALRAITELEGKVAQHRAEIEEVHKTCAGIQGRLEEEQRLTAKLQGALSAAEEQVKWLTAERP